MNEDDFERDLEAALATRPVIEQAKGVLSLARCSTPEQAYAELRFVSQQHNIKVSRLAAALVEATSGRKPDDPLLRKVLWQEWNDLLEDCDPS